MWQEIIVGIFVLAAIGFWLRKLFPQLGGKKANATDACGSCKNCSDSSGGCH